jgi:hypothetical protein
LRSLPKDERYWIKLDGTDVTPAIQESTRGEWNGDTDLQDGQLQSLREAYISRKERISSIPDLNTLSVWIEHLEIMKMEITEDVELLTAQYKKACQEYSTSSNASIEKQKEMSWECVEYSHLLKTSQDFISNIDDLLQEKNIKAIAFHLKRMTEEMRDYLCKLYKKRRTAATHVLVVMVSSEKRDKKPYALPIRYVPYKSLKDADMRAIIEETKEQMKDLGLKVVGEL